VYVTAEQRRKLISEVGDAGALLYTYYLEKSGIKDFKFEDESAAKTLGWNIHKVLRNRRALTKTNWFYQSTFKNASNKKVKVTYLGKETVTAFKDENDPIWLDLAKLRKVMDIMEVTTVEELKSDLSKAKEIWETL